MDKQVKELVTFLNAAHSVYHATALLVKELENAGYTRLEEGESWSLIAGGKYYLTRGGTALISFRGFPLPPVQ